MVLFLDLWLCIPLQIFSVCLNTEFRILWFECEFIYNLNFNFWIFRQGRRRELIIASVLYLLGSLVTGFAPSLQILILGRLLFGTGIGLVCLCICFGRLYVHCTLWHVHGEPVLSGILFSTMTYLRIRKQNIKWILGIVAMLNFIVHYHFCQIITRSYIGAVLFFSHRLCMELHYILPKLHHQKFVER